MRTRQLSVSSLLPLLLLLALPLAAHQKGTDKVFDVPPKFLSGKNPEYTPDALRAKVEGDVVLDVVITEEGKVLEVVIVKGLPFGLDEAAVASVFKWRYEPAQLNGKAVRCKQEVRIPFRLPQQKQ